MQCAGWSLAGLSLRQAKLDRADFSEADCTEMSLQKKCPYRNVLAEGVGDRQSMGGRPARSRQLPKS
jgi:hypothetical protein